MITLREQNRKLSNNHNHRLKIESDLRKRIEQLEDTLKQCEDKEPENQLTVVNEDLRNRVDELEFELNKSRLNERRLADDLDRINSEFNEMRKKSNTSSTSTLHHQTNSDSIRNSTSDQHHHQNQLGNSTNSSTNSNAIDGELTGKFILANSSITQHTSDTEMLVSNQAKAIQELELKLAEQLELATNRLKELENLTEQHTEAILTIDRLKSDAKCIPKEVILESSEYKTLQSHFSVLYNEATQLKTQLVESRALIVEMKTTHARHIERMEHEEIKVIRDLRTKINELTGNYHEYKNKFNNLQLDHEELKKTHEQTLKLDLELKRSVQGYKVQVQQKNNDIGRLKRLLEEAKRERHHNDSKSASHATNNGDNLNNSVTNHSTSTNTTNSPSKPQSNKSSSSSNAPTNAVAGVKLEPTTNNSVSNNHSPPHKKILELKEVIHQLQRQLEKTKGEEEALMQDLDVTGQAYEDVQDQNSRLLEQLEEKDDANFKLMSEHLKANAFKNHLNEEKQQMEEHREELMKRIAAQNIAEKNLSEKIKLLQENMSTLEKELEIRNNINDAYKQEKLELNQQLAELKLEKDKVMNHLEQIQRILNERTSTLTHESFKNKRLIEELESLKKKYERANKLQSATTPDEVLMEEIREYKEQLTCPSCKTKPKDAVLTKCFHVFCFDCLKTRVDTRQRKCPKCNAQFGANDFHRLYLA